MVWSKIEKKVLAPLKGVEEAINSFYDIEGQNYSTIEAMVDIKEWAKDWPDDRLFSWQVYRNAIYLLQVKDLKGYIKVLTPSHTYVYDIYAFHLYEDGGSKSNFGLFEVLDEGTIIYGHVFIDLNNLIACIIGDTDINRLPTNLKNWVPAIKSTKRINSTSWLVLDTLIRDERSLQITLYQRTSFFNCLDCKNKRKILEAMDFTDRLKNLDCSDEEATNVRAQSLQGDTSKMKTSELKTMVLSEGMLDNADRLEFDTGNIGQCLENFKKLTSSLNSLSQGGSTQDYFKDISMTCSPDMLSMLVEYIVAYYKAKSLHENFIKDYYDDKNDKQEVLGNLFEDVKEIYEYVSVVTYGVTKLAGGVEEALKGLKSIFKFAFLWGVLYFKLYEDSFKNKDGSWIERNPYSVLNQVKFDDFYTVVVQLIAGLDIDFKFPFPLRKTTVKKTKLESQDATFYSLGPAGCVSRIDFHTLPLKTIENIVDVEVMPNGDMLIWAWADVNGFSNVGNEYLVNTIYPPEYKIKIFKLNTDDKTVQLMYEEVVPKGWHMMEHRKMAVSMPKDKSCLYIRDYYISEYTNGEIKSLDYTEIKKRFTDKFSNLVNGVRAVYFNSNINNVMFGRVRLNHVVSPGFPRSKMGPKDLGDPTLRVKTPFFYN